MTTTFFFPSNPFSLFLTLFVASSLLIGFRECHCPHMMGMKAPAAPSGPSPPGKHPDGDDGWDYDETAAPGIVPDPHFIQSTYVYRAVNVQEKKFAERVMEVLKNIRERLAKTARLTLENENIECASPTDHYRCQEYSTSGSWNYLIVEDQANGAATYTFERKNNEKNDGTIEMALLDALSRHSPNSLIAFASPESEKEVGYIRALTTQELNSMGSPKPSRIAMEKYGPNELNLLEPALLEVRTGAGLSLDSQSLFQLGSPEQFDEALDAYKAVFVLFWNKNRMVSLHTFDLWSRVGEQFGKSEETLLAHVACHVTPDFCHGLDALDFQTVVAYKNGQNVGKTENVGDLEYYRRWIELMLAEPLYKIADESELKELKKTGFLRGEKRAAVTIGTFSDESDTSFQHFKIAAEKLAGKYYLTYFIAKKTTTPSITTYRFAEKQKRADYSGRFDPATLMEFLTRSALPSVIDITVGFSTDLLLRQKRPILILIAFSPAKRDFEPFSKLAARQEARKSLIFAKIDIDSEKEIGGNLKKCLEALGVEIGENAIVLLNKDRVHKIAITQPKCADHLQKIVHTIATGEAEKVLSTREPHPLRYLQVEAVNALFGFEETIVLPDHTLFLDADPFARATAAEPTAGGSGGCPFMQGGGGGGETAQNAHHTEL